MASADGGAAAGRIGRRPDDAPALAPAAAAPTGAGRMLRRVPDLLGTYLPLLLMALLALGSWWLVKNTPLFEDGRAAAPLRHTPDYTMTDFLVQRFAPDGAKTTQLEGDLMRHYPDTETIEIDNPRLQSIAKDGRVTVATGRSALSNKDGSEVVLKGDAHLTRAATASELAIEFRSEFLHYVQATEQVTTPLPVILTQGTTEIHADAMVYDNLARRADFTGKIRAVLAPLPRK